MSYIGLDVGGTNVRYAFVKNLNSEKVIYQKTSFVKTGDPCIEVEKNICDVVDKFPGKIKGIGISLAANMVRNTGKVKTWPNNPCWNDYALLEHLDKRYGSPVIIEDDANCGAISEYQFLSTNLKNMAYISIGTGIGCGLILNGSLFIGENGFAGEIGHMCINKEESEQICKCGNKGCLQSIVSPTNIIRKYNKENHMLINSLEEIYKQYLQNNSIAIDCIVEMLDIISILIYNIALCLDISVFVIGGGINKILAGFITTIEAQVNERLSKFKRKISVVQSHLGEFSGVYGALQLLK